MRDSPARKKIVVLDCCFSGRALDIMGAEPGLVTANLDLTGQLLRVLEDRMWRGEAVDFSHHDGDCALFSLVAGGAAATV